MEHSVYWRLRYTDEQLMITYIALLLWVNTIGFSLIHSLYLNEKLYHNDTHFVTGYTCIIIGILQLIIKKNKHLGKIIWKKRPDNRHILFLYKIWIFEYFAFSHLFLGSRGTKTNISTDFGAQYFYENNTIFLKYVKGEKKFKVDS